MLDDTNPTMLSIRDLLDAKNIISAARLKVVDFDAVWQMLYRVGCYLDSRLAIQFRAVLHG